MLEELTRSWWVPVLRGAFAIVFGILALVWPGVTILALAILWGIYALFDGVSAISMAMVNKQDTTSHRWWIGVVGGVGVLAGVFALVWPGVTALILLLIIAFWALIAGVLQIAAAIRLRKVIENEWFLGIAGVLTLLLGILLLLRPGDGAVAVVAIIGIFAILWGITLILFGVRLRGLSKQVTG